MAERTTVTQVVQVGVEATPGTSVAASKKLPSLSIGPAVKANVDSFRPLGNKFSTIHALGKEWTESKISGSPTYTEIVYLLASLLQYTAPVAQVEPAAFLWAHNPSSIAEDAVKTYTVENGSALRAHKFTYGIVNELTLSGDREKIELSGMMLGRQLQDGITLTATPTSIAQVPILPKEISVYVDEDSGDLGTTKLTRLLKWELGIKSRFGPLWVVDAALASWVTHVELPVEAQLKLLVEADEEGMAFLSLLRSGDTRFVRIEGISADEADTGFPFSLEIDLAAQVADAPGEFADEAGVYAIEFTFNLVHDSTWAKAIAAQVVNTVSAL